VRRAYNFLLRSTVGQAQALAEYSGSRHLGSHVPGTAAIVRWFSRLH
jgi:hypothetical protein